MGIGASTECIRPAKCGEVTCAIVNPCPPPSTPVIISLVAFQMLYRLANQEGGFTPKRYFSVDRVFRNETMDATHLCEFHQVRYVLFFWLNTFSYDNYTGVLWDRFVCSLSGTVFGSTVLQRLFPGWLKWLLPGWLKWLLPGWLKWLLPGWLKWLLFWLKWLLSGLAKVVTSRLAAAVTSGLAEGSRSG